jgi:arginyl-tRNA--protein-N-Asp/Glu arginylyltransferase
MYLTWAEKTIIDFSDDNINSLYNEGFLFTREHRGSMYQTRSLRIDLSKFELSSENKRILKKTEDIGLKTYDIPYTEYSWLIGKLGKDFYETKFGLKTFSANKIKELLTTEHNFNKLFIYNNDLGYAICRETDELLHYSYPFYNLKPNTQYLIPNIGMGMMLRAIVWAKENNKKYIYLGSAQRPTDTYKLQFAGLQWFDGTVWKSDLEELKNILK